MSKLNKAKSISLSGISKGSFSNSDQFFKMSKKIAQLTKVVAYLHSKQDDHDTEIHSTKDAYENEIYLVLKDAKQKIEILHDTSVNDQSNHNLILQVKFLQKVVNNYRKKILL